LTTQVLVRQKEERSVKAQEHEGSFTKRSKETSNTSKITHHIPSIVSASTWKSSKKFTEGGNHSITHRDKYSYSTFA
jgi:hypothetical protein